MPTATEAPACLHSTRWLCSSPVAGGAPCRRPLASTCACFWRRSSQRCSRRIWSSSSGMRDRDSGAAGQIPETEPGRAGSAV
eukprot:scaffold13307_cov97-Isochrysis_galbana.AAC.1